MTGGIDDFENEDRKEERAGGDMAVIDFAEEKKKRKPYHVWKVGDREYRLKLTVDMICRVEDKYGKSLISMLDDAMPLPVMLTVIQAAMKKFEHGIKYDDVKQIYASWVEDGGSQTELYTKVVIPVLAVSGFFPEKNTAAILEELDS